MGGGLINIVSYVSTDLYLTGAPQITFYKMVYRRYTNFSMESISLDFDDDIKFDYESELLPPRAGDLIHKGYLQIEIPKINISKLDVGIDTSDISFEYNDKEIVTNYTNIKSVYMDILANIYRIIYRAVNASNVTYTGLIQDVQEYISNENRVTVLGEYDDLLSLTRTEFIAREDPREGLLNSKRSNLWYILSHIDINKLHENAVNSIDEEEFPPDSEEYNKEVNRIMKVSAFREIEIGLEICQEVQKIFFDEYQKFIARVEMDKNQNIRSAWVDNLGHAFIEYIDVYIGGNRIDRHLGIWINIWYQLTYKQAQIPIYNKLIGNVAELTNFDNCEKPNYTIYVPLTFWFNKFNGLSFPLIAMQYNDIRFNVKMRKFEEVFYIEKIYRADVNGSEKILTANLIDFLLNRSENRGEISVENIEEVQDISLIDIWEEKGKSLHGHILMDYIFLESPERKRFAQSGHEYLIERIQHDTFKTRRQLNFDVQLDFTNPSKELLWVFHKGIFAVNPFGWNKCRWDNYTTGVDMLNPVDTFSLAFNTYTRIQKQIGTYFDAYQPLFYHNVSPTRGINLYSFCTDPLQQQPTGSCNFSRLTDVKMFILINALLFRYRDPDIYPYDLNINFTLTLTEPQLFIDSIDKTCILTEIEQLERVEESLPDDKKQHLDDLRTLIEILKEIEEGERREIELKYYRLICFKTDAEFTVFSLTMNILRLIGGYGALAFAGNN